MEKETRAFLESFRREVTQRLDSMDERFDAVEKRFDTVDQRQESLVTILAESFSGLEDRFDRVDEQLETITDDVTTLKQVVAGDLETRLRQVEEVIEG